jgi:hypothetical protein
VGRCEELFVLIMMVDALGEAADVISNLKLINPVSQEMD